MADKNLWRLTKSQYPALTGDGGLYYPGRWHNIGFPVVYLADSPGSALLEILVHLETRVGELPNDYIWLHLTLPDDLEIPLLHTPADDSWRDNLTLTRHLGDGWLASRQSALARVPSAILPFTFNYLLNPLHPDAAHLTLTSSQQAFFDPRLLRL